MNFITQIEQETLANVDQELAQFGKQKIARWGYRSHSYASYIAPWLADADNLELAALQAQVTYYQTSNRVVRFFLWLFRPVNFRFELLAYYHGAKLLSVLHDGVVMPDVYEPAINKFLNQETSFAALNPSQTWWGVVFRRWLIYLKARLKERQGKLVLLHVFFVKPVKLRHRETYQAPLYQLKLLLLTIAIAY